MGGAVMSNAFIKDISLFFVIYFIFIAFSAVFQIIVTRVIRPKGFFTQILGLPIISVMLGSVFCYLFLSMQFSNISSYYLANLLLHNIYSP